MAWLVDLLRTESVGQALTVLSVIIAAGLGLGSLKFRGIGLGVAGVLFAGLATGDVLHRASIRLEHSILEFAREFGLILFVYSIGMQVGPGFFASLRRDGLRLNALAAAVVLLGALMTVAIHFGLGVEMPLAAGLFSGATTNTPALAAAQAALRDLPGGVPEATLNLPAMGYAVAYPFGIVGIILSMLAIKAIFRIRPAAEAAALAAAATASDGENGAAGEQSNEPLDTVNLEIANPNLEGLPLRRVPTLGDGNVVISRIWHDGRTALADAETVLHQGDVLLAVGPAAELDALRLVVGKESELDVRSAPSPAGRELTAGRVIVTHTAALGRTIDNLRLRRRFGVNVTRLSRAEIELPPAGVRLQFGDSLNLVGTADAIARAGAELGNSPKRLMHTQVAAVFVGILLGVLAGSLPIVLPGLPAPLRLGLAGGPLIVAILLARLGHVGPLVWYVPPAANFALRELGIVLFLAVVGLKSGEGFLHLLIYGGGLSAMALGALITVVPILTVALFARAVLKLNYVTLCGVLAGSMTDPPALAFAASLNGSDGIHVSYAAVYPLVMLLRVLTAQLMVLVLM